MRGVFVSDRQPGPVAPLSSWAVISAPCERPPAISRIRPAGRRTSGLSNGARPWCATIWTAACWSRRWALSRMAHAYCLLSSQPLRPGSPQARSTGLAARDSLRSCRLVLSKFPPCAWDIAVVGWVQPINGDGLHPSYVGASSEFCRGGKIENIPRGRGESPGAASLGRRPQAPVCTEALKLASRPGLDCAAERASARPRRGGRSESPGTEPLVRVRRIQKSPRFSPEALNLAPRPGLEPGTQ